jgi:hypothetical protein
MAGMLQILTYLLAFYLVIKGVEVLQIGLASVRPNRALVLVIGSVALVFCIGGAILFTFMQDTQAASLSANVTSPPSSAP